MPQSFAPDKEDSSEGGLTNKVSYSHREEMRYKDPSRTTARRVRKQQAWRSDRTVGDHRTKLVAVSWTEGL